MKENPHKRIAGTNVHLIDKFIIRRCVKVTFLSGDKKLKANPVQRVISLTSASNLSHTPPQILQTPPPPYMRVTHNIQGYYNSGRLPLWWFLFVFTKYGDMVQISKRPPI